MASNIDFLDTQALPIWRLYFYLLLSAIWPYRKVEKERFDLINNKKSTCILIYESLIYTPNEWTLVKSKGNQIYYSWPLASLVRCSRELSIIVVLYQTKLRLVKRHWMDVCFINQCLRKICLAFFVCLLWKDQFPSGTDCTYCS